MVVFFVPSLFRSLENECISFKERVRHSLFVHRALLNSPSHAPANGDPTEPKPQEDIRAGVDDEERNKDDLFHVSPVSTFPHWLFETHRPLWLLIPRRVWR
jgi:hypothetical protein